MYEAHWNLQCRPFDDLFDAKFFVPSSTHQAAVLKLKYHVEHQRGAALLIGANGVGKTRVLAQLDRELPEEFQPLVHVPYPRMSPLELLSFLAGELGAHEPPVADERAGMDRVIRRLQRQLAAHAGQDHRPVVIIDDAHMIDDESVLESLQMLLNLQQESDAPFGLLLAGQPGFAPRVGRLGQLNDRIGIRAGLEALDQQESQEYVRRRLKAAGRTQPVFQDNALRKLADHSAGIPRRLNRLCDMALLVGYADGLTTISEELIDDVRMELDLPRAA